MSDSELDNTKTQCGHCGLVPDETDGTVTCTCCKRKFHYTCVGVTSAVQKKKKWYCADTNCQKAKSESRSKKGTNPDPEESDESSATSLGAQGVLSAEERMKAMKDEQQRRAEEWETEKRIREKQMSMQFALRKKMLQEDRELREKERALELELEDESREIEFKEKNDELQAKLQARQDHLKRMQELENGFRGQLSALEEELAKMKSSRKVEKQLSGGKKTQSQNQEEKQSDDDSDESEDDSEESSSDESEQEGDPVDIGSQQPNQSSNGLEKKKKKKTGPTREQLAARHGISKHLPPFSGKPEDWPLFYAAYTSSTKACGYSKVDNLARLQQCLQGNALELVRGQLLLPKSVPRVIKKLRKHFGRPEQLLQKFLNRIQKLEQPKKLQDFIPFGNVVEQLCEHLEAADLKEHLKNPLLINDLAKKLPDAEKREWAEVKRKRGNKKVTLRTLTDFLTRIVDDACEAGVDIEFPVMSGESAEMSYKDRGRHSRKMFHDSEEESSSESTVSDEDIGRKYKPCKACQHTDHGLRFCQEFKDMPYAERAKLVSRERLCCVCLNGHGGQCRMKIRCNIGDCREAHNPLMHPVNVETVGLSAHIRTGDDVMFRVVPIQLHCGERTSTVLAFLDEGASVTLMESKLADSLGLEGVNEKLKINWTGNVTRVEKKSRRMNVCASAVDLAEDLLLKNVRTVEQLLLPWQRLDSEELAARYEHFRGLPIESYDGRPKILIGLNNLHAFRPIDSVFGADEEPIAVQCQLGWTVYGPTQTGTARTHNYLGVHVELIEDQKESYCRQLVEKVFTKITGNTAGLKKVEGVERTSKRDLKSKRKLELAERVRSIEKRKNKSTKLVTFSRIEPVKNVRATNSRVGAYRADGDASARSSCCEGAGLPDDGKEQLPSSGVKLASDRLRAERASAAAARTVPSWVMRRRGLESECKSGASGRRPDVTGWSMLPRLMSERLVAGPSAESVITDYNTLPPAHDERVTATKIKT